ncbi:uncharacterized protein N7459_006676 [Penicillium hispanicum]|uniref:uncharacterized protein n=1 Tax=Penicillium hispanicum TaxID=1080232 RepID=UPI002540575F|nr:uncharacterized protein N7459_006676 [Penicillium hispanicum]KAJ5577712.1 hypothetical protein N7459_006676 [Penicillium hispanicum]
MSSGLPFLNKLRKPELVEFAERTDLTNYGDYNKADLAVALDNHLRENKSIYSGDQKLADYYKRLSAGSTRGGSPVKRETRVEVSPVLEKKTPGRRPTKQKEEPATESDEPVKTPSAAVRASARSPRSVRSIVDSAQFAPPSPAVVTDAIDRQTTKMREGLENAWTASGVLERSQTLRSALSSVQAVEAIILTLEGGSLLKALLPLRFVTTTPAVPAVHLPPLSIKLPDLFVLLTSAFWAPLLLWTLTSLVLPLVAAYFINLSWQAATGGSHAGRRTRSASSRASFDPLTFNIAKALLVYKVYADQYTFYDLLGKTAIEKVDASVPGHWAGMLTGTAIGVIGTLYEAILRRS